MTQRKLVNRVKRIRGQLDAIERLLSEANAGGDVLIFLANIRGGVNSLLAATLATHIEHIFLSERQDSAASRELPGLLIDLVHAYLK